MQTLTKAGTKRRKMAVSGGPSALPAPWHQGFHARTPADRARCEHRPGDPYMNASLKGGPTALALLAGAMPAFARTSSSRSLTRAASRCTISIRRPATRRAGATTCLGKPARSSPATRAPSPSATAPTSASTTSASRRPKAPSPRWPKSISASSRATPSPTDAVLREPAAPAHATCHEHCYSRAAIAGAISAGTTAGAKRSATCPSRPTRNLAKFHSISPGCPALSQV